MARYLSYTQKTNVTSQSFYLDRIVLKLQAELILKIFSDLIDVTFHLIHKVIYALVKNCDPFKFSKISLWVGHYVEIEYILPYQVLRG